MSDAIEIANRPCTFCREPGGATTFSDAFLRVFRAVRAFMAQRRAWSLYLGGQGYAMPWQDPFDRLCIVTGMVCGDITADHHHVGGSGTFLKAHTRWLVERKGAAVHETSEKTINAWWNVRFGWDDAIAVLDEMLADIESGRWTPIDAPWAER